MLQPRRRFVCAARLDLHSRQNWPQWGCGDTAAVMHFRQNPPTSYLYTSTRAFRMQHGPLRCPAAGRLCPPADHLMIAPLPMLRVLPPPTPLAHSTHPPPAPPPQKVARRPRHPSPKRPSPMGHGVATISAPVYERVAPSSPPPPNNCLLLFAAGCSGTTSRPSPPPCSCLKPQWPVKRLPAVEIKGLSLL